MQQVQEKIEEYNPEEYLTEYKNFLAQRIYDFFMSLEIFYIPYLELRRVGYDSNLTYISNFMKLYGIEDTSFNRAIVKQFFMIYIISNIYQDNTYYKSYNEDYNITYSGFQGTVNGNLYDCKPFPDGFYIIPDVINKKIIDRIYHISSFLLNDRFNQIRFTMTNDFLFGDICPPPFYCLITTVMKMLSENMVAFFEKAKFFIDRNKKFIIQPSTMNTEEVVIILPTKTKVTYNNNNLVLGPGSIIVLKRSALYTVFELENLESRQTSFMIFC